MVKRAVAAAHGDELVARGVPPFMSLTVQVTT